MTDQTNTEAPDVFNMTEDELRVHRQDLVEQQKDASTVDETEQLGRDIATVDMILVQHQIADEDDPQRLAELEEQENEYYHRSLGIVDDESAEDDDDDADDDISYERDEEDEDPCELDFN